MELLRLTLQIVGYCAILWLCILACRNFFGKAGRYRRKLRRELATAHMRTLCLADELARLPDEVSRYRFLAQHYSDRTFLTDGWYWRVADDHCWIAEDRNNGVAIPNPIVLTGLQGASSITHALTLPHVISLPGLTLGVMTLEGVAEPTAACSSFDKIKFNLYRDINLRGLTVSALHIPDSVTTLRNLSDYPAISDFRFPVNMQRGSGATCLCNCPQLRSVTLPCFPLDGFTTFLENCPSLERIIAPTVASVIATQRASDTFMDSYGRRNIDFSQLFITRRNPVTGNAIELIIQDAAELFHHFHMPDTFDEAESITHFLADFPDCYSLIHHIDMPSDMQPIVDDTDQSSDRQQPDTWQLSTDDRPIHFPLHRCPSLQSSPTHTPS